MSKLLKRLNDNQNKVADTNGIMKLQAWDYGIAQDLTNKKITATVANASGFLFDIDLVSNGTEINLDFKDSQLQKLTPDTYFLEIKVTDEDGDVSVFPTEGYAIFTINKNLHATEGALVPQITFDTVLADVKTAMDKKVADYVKTIAKGDKGDKGDTPDITVGGRNLLQGTQEWKGDWVKLPLWLVGKETYTSLVVRYRSLAWYSLGQFYDANPNTTYTFSFYAKASEAGNFMSISTLDKEDWNSPVVSVPLFPNQAITTDWKRYSITFTTKSGGRIFPSVCSNRNGVTIYVAGYKLEEGNVPTDWTPAPEDVPSNDAQLVHKTGNEVLAGDKTFTGNTTLATTTILAGNYGLRVTPSGFQKTTDGKTWVSANI